jgi:aspartyl aminopeptidase
MVFADREEVGSMGLTGMRSAYLNNFLEALCEGYNKRKAFANSAAISADVSVAFDPNFAEVYEAKNSAFVNQGVAFSKYTGSGGKSGASEASPEFMAKLCKIFDDAGALYQMAELGKVDQGGGGTVSQFIADLNIEVVDIGVAILCMHAPYEVAGKTDIYMLHKACKAFYENY